MTGNRDFFSTVTIIIKYYAASCHNNLKGYTFLLVSCPFSWRPSFLNSFLMSPPKTSRKTWKLLVLTVSSTTFQTDRVRHC